jgi:hypothetical protein
VNISLGEADRTTIDALVASLEAAWTAGDADAFAADADFVNVRAEHHRGRAAIAAGHAAILLHGLRGQRGGQAAVPGVGGTCKDLTDNVNWMASNLTGGIEDRT